MSYGYFPNIYSTLPPLRGNHVVWVGQVHRVVHPLTTDGFRLVRPETSEHGLPFPEGGIRSAASLCAQFATSGD